jgi:hypothetical protein
MSRSGYSESCEGWDLIRWRGAVASAIRGKRGQAFLREMLAALDAIPDKCLIVEELKQDGSVCALGAIGVARGMDLDVIDPEDRDSVAEAFKIPLTLACEIMYENDEGGWRETPQQRWSRMRKWAEGQIAACA